MPIYEFVCASGHEFEFFLVMDNRNEKTLCSCGLQGKRIVSLFSAKVFKEQVIENLGDQPVRVSSARQLKEEAKKRGLIPVDEKINVREIVKRKKEALKEEISKSVEKNWRPIAEKAWDTHMRSV